MKTSRLLVTFLVTLLTVSSVEVAQQSKPPDTPAERSVATSDESKLPIKLLETSEGFHGDEVTAQTGDVWLGLFRSGERHYLRSTKIVVSLVNDPIVDEENEKTGKSVATKIKDPPVFLIKSPHTFREAVVPTLFSAPEPDESTSLNNGDERTFSYRGTSYRLFIPQSGSGEKFLSEDSRLLLTDGKHTQVLRTLDRCDDCGWSLHWVGDLDMDGKLDFYMDLNSHYNVSDKRLFLSSFAGPGELVKYVGNFTTVGC